MFEASDAVRLNSIVRAFSRSIRFQAWKRWKEHLCRADRTLPIAIYYEQPNWFKPLFAELDRRGTNYVKLECGGA